MKNIRGFAKNAVKFCGLRDFLMAILRKMGVKIII
jgi:hypothetical protein